MAKRKQCGVPGCKEVSLPGLVRPLCQYHYDEFMWGTVWAKRCKAEREAKALRP